MRLPSAAGLALALGFLTLYFLVAATVGWHGPPASWDAYGEPPTGGWVQEPLCFWSNLGFMLAGVLALRRLERAPTPAPNPMAGPSAASVGFGLLIVWMGPASMLEHGTLTTRWGWFDATSIHWFAVFVTAYLGTRALPRARIAFIVAGVSAVVAIGGVTWQRETWRAPVTQALLALVSVAVVAAFFLGRLVGLVFAAGAGRALAIAAAAFAVGAALLVAGQRGAPLAPWAHAGWHLACAVAMYFVMHLLAQEKETNE